MCVFVSSCSRQGLVRRISSDSDETSGCTTILTVVEYLSNKHEH